MIRKLTSSDWQKFLLKFKDLAYIDHKLINKKRVNEPVHHTLFSDALVELKVCQDSQIFNSFIFNNAGLVNIMIQDPESGEIMPAVDEDGEFNLVKEFPEALSITCQFIYMMLEKFGKDYLTPRIVHSDNMRREMDEYSRNIKDQYDGLKQIYGYLKTDKSCILSEDFLNAEKEGYKSLYNYIKRPSEFYGISYTLTYPYTRIPVPKPKFIKLLKESPMDSLIHDEIYLAMDELSDEYKASTAYSEIQTNLMNYISNTYISQRFKIIDCTKKEDDQSERC